MQVKVIGDGRLGEQDDGAQICRRLIRREMRLKGMTGAELAQMVGANPTVTRRILSGKSGGRITFWKTALRAFGYKLAIVDRKGRFIEDV